MLKYRIWAALGLVALVPMPFLYREREVAPWVFIIWLVAGFAMMSVDVRRRPKI